MLETINCVQINELWIIKKMMLSINYSLKIVIYVWRGFDIKKPTRIDIPLS